MSPVQPGDRFGKLVVRRELRTVWTGRLHQTRLWKCDCDCGGTREVQQNCLTGRRWAVDCCEACQVAKRKLRNHRRRAA